MLSEAESDIWSLYFLRTIFDSFGGICDDLALFAFLEVVTSN